MQIAILQNVDDVSKPVPLRLDLYDYRIIFFATACLIYAIFGSPTPERIGSAEIGIGLFLFLSIGIGRLYDVVLYLQRPRFWKSSGRAFLIYGLSAPVLIGIVSGYGYKAVIRDLIPFLFLFLPLFFLPLIRARPYYFRVTVILILIIGLLFSLRSFVMGINNQCPIWCVDKLLYLENMPTVLFSCLFLIGSAMLQIMRGMTFRNLAVFSVLILLSLIPVAAMVGTLQRASIGAVVLYVALIQLYFFYKSPARALGLLVLGVVALWVINISFSSMFQALWHKTQIVGLNMRPQEFEAVWNVVTRNPVTFLFGIGWGGHFHSPAVGGLSVNFTHNFFSTVLLKSGMVGIVFCTGYIFGLLERMARVSFKNPVLGLALSAPILIDLTLYASFKSFDFGLMLLMISGSLVYLRKSESTCDKK